MRFKGNHIAGICFTCISILSQSEYEIYGTAASLAWKRWSSGSPSKTSLRGFRLSSERLQRRWYWRDSVACSRTLTMYRASTVMYNISGRRTFTDVAAFSISSEYSLSLTHSRISFPLSLSLFFFWCPQWATRARLRPFKNMEPVWPEWLLWKSSGLPDGLSPTRGGPRRKEEIRWRKVLSNNHTSSPRSSRDRLTIGCRRERTRVKDDRSFVFYSRDTTHRDLNIKKDMCERAICRVQTDEETSYLGELEGEVPRPYEVRPGREIDAFSCLHAAYISLRKNNN